MSSKCACAQVDEKLEEALRRELPQFDQSGCLGDALELQLEYIRVHETCSCRAKEEEEAAAAAKEPTKCACERAKEEIDELIRNPSSKEVGSGRLRDVMEAEDNFFRVRERCSCRAKSDSDDSPITHVDSEEEGEQDDERNVEEDVDDEVEAPARGEKRPRSDDEDEDEGDKRLRIASSSFEIWVKPFDPLFQLSVVAPSGRENEGSVTLDDRKVYAPFLLSLINLISFDFFI